jgi:teichuronic acid exporter
LSSVPETVSGSVRQSQLDRSLVSGIAWTGTVKWIAQALSWASVLVLARLLSPDDYGLLGMANVYIGLVAMVNEFGIGTAVVAQRSLEGNQVRQINALAVLIGGVCTALSCAAAVPVAAFYRVPELRWVIAVMSPSFVISAFRTVPQAVMSREMSFKLVAKIEGLQVTVQALSTVAFAMLGMAYWSLVLGILVGATTGSILVYAIKPVRFELPRWKSIRELFAFSQQVVVGRIAWYVQTNADFLVAGRFLGKTALGYYTFACALASLPVDKITAFVNQVTFPLFSAVQSDQAALRRYLLKLTEFLSLIAFPLAWGLMAVSHEFVLVVLGEKWIQVVLPLQLLAFYTILRTVSPLLSQILLVVGESRFVKNLSLVSTAFLTTGFYIGAHWGTAGIAAAWVIIHPVLTFAAYRRTFRRIGMSAREYLRSMSPAFCAAFLMTAVLVIFRTLLPLNLRPGLVLAIQVAVGAIVYAGPLLIFNRQRLRAFMGFLTEMRQAAPEDAVPTY